MDDDAEIEVEMLVGFLPESMQGVAMELLEACAKEQGTDPCNKMYKMGKCVQAKRPDVSIYTHVCLPPRIVICSYICWVLI